MKETIKMEDVKIGGVYMSGYGNASYVKVLGPGKPGEVIVKVLLFTRFSPIGYLATIELEQIYYQVWSPWAWLK